MKPADPSSSAALRRHWHLIARHVHPDWHGHCLRAPLAAGVGDMVTEHTCHRLHWHFLWRHRHTETGR